MNNNQNKVSNPKTEVPKGMNLNDKDYITCLLMTLKCMEKNYAIVLTEASNESLYKKYYQTFEKISALQRKVYETMFQKGWYSLEKAEKNKIMEKANMLNQELTDLNG